MSTMDYALLFGACLVIFLFVGVWVAHSSNQRRKRAYAATASSFAASAATGSGAATAAATPTTPTTPPAPAPAAVARSYGWVLWLIIIIAIVFVGRWVWYEGRSVRSTYSPPQATAPGKTVRQKLNLNINLPGAIDMAKSDHAKARIISGVPAVFIEKDGKVYLEIDRPLPKAEYALYMDYDLSENKSGYYTLDINGIIYPHIFMVKEGKGKILTIPKEIIKDKNYIAISPNTAMRVKCLWLEEL